MTNWDWVAGLLEGEGCFMVNKNNKASYKKRNGEQADRPEGYFNWKPCVTINMTDKDVIIKYWNEIDNRGNYLELAPPTVPNRKQVYRVSTYKHDDCRWVMSNVYPLMGNRRQEKIREVFSTMGWEF